MTREAWVFQRALLASLVLHALLLTLFFTLPGGGPSEPVQIYTVRILEAPAQPQARALELSTDVISALKLESPSLRADAPPPPPPEEAEVPEMERFPGLTPPAAAPAAAAPPTPAARSSLTPPQQPAAPATPDVAPPAPGAARELPRLPGLPAPQPPAAAPRAPSAPSPGARALAPPLPGVEEEPERQSAMERLRSKVQTLDLQVEAEPAQRPTTTPTPTRERNVLALRLYSNRVREAVKEQYAFPGGFAPGLRTRVRVTLNRDGSVLRTEILEPSGNDRFDRLVCLAAIRNAKIPPVPQAVEGEGDTLRLHFTCSP